MTGGLLDFLRTPEGQGLLAAGFGAAAGARPGQPWNTLGRGGLAGLAGYSNALDREQQAQDSEYTKRYRDMQMKGLESQIAQRDADLAEKARINGILANSFMPTTGSNANARSGITGPRPEAANMIGSQPSVNYQQLIAMGVPPDRVKALADARDYGRSEVARTVKGVGPDGKEYEYQVDKFGQLVGDGLAQYRAPIQADTGGSIQFLDPYTQQPVSSLAKSMSPDAKASNALGWANYGIAKDRLAMDRSTSGSNGFTFNADLGGYIPKAPGGKFVPLDGIPAGGKAGNASEGERKAATLLARMDGSLAQMQAALKEDPGAAKPGLFAEAVRRAPFGGGDTPANVFTPEARQRVEAAQLDILDAALTLGTGAAYTKEQLEGYRRSYFPQIGDGPKQVQDKRDRLNNVLEAARIAAGRAAPAQTKSAKPQAAGDPLAGFRIVEVR